MPAACIVQPHGMPLLRKWLRQFIVETIGHMILNSIFPCSQCFMLMHWAIGWCIFNYNFQLMRATAIIRTNPNVCGRWFGTFSTQCLMHLWPTQFSRWRSSRRGATCFQPPLKQQTSSYRHNFSKQHSGLAQEIWYLWVLALATSIAKKLMSLVVSPLCYW